MPSGSKKRKASKKKKQAGGALVQNQQQGNEQEVENENDHDQEQDQGQEDDPITPKIPDQTNEGEEKEKGQVEGGSSDTEGVGLNQNPENRTQTSFQEVESTNIDLVIPENGGGGLEKEAEDSSGGVLEDKNGPIGDLGPLTSTEEGPPNTAPERTSSSSSSSSSSSHHVRDNVDEIHHDEKETRTDVGIIVAHGLNDGDESEVSSSKLVVSEENEPNQTLGPSTNVVDEILPSSKDDGDSQVEMEAPSEEVESSDGDESKLDVVSTMATLDANESIQSVGSVGSPRSVYSQQNLDQISTERPEFVSQDHDRGSEGFSEGPFQEPNSNVDCLNAESDDKPVYQEQIEGMEFSQEEDVHENTLTEESLEGLRNGNIQVSTEVVSEFPQKEDCHENTLTEESLEGLRNENIQVSTEVVIDKYVTAMEELTQVVTDLENPGIATLNEETEAIPKVDEHDAKESVMPLPKSESLNTRHISVDSTSGEAGEKEVSTEEANGDGISTSGQANQASGQANQASGQANQDVGSTGKVGMESIQVQGTSADPNEISDKEIALHPQNGTNEKKINLPQRESRTSWLSCCGIVDLFTPTRGL